MVPSADYLALAADYDAHFMNIAVDGATASMELVQRCHFEAELVLDREAAEFTNASITYSGVVRPMPRAPGRGRIPATGHG